MSALLVKDAPTGLHEWLKTEASCNRRSLNQQVLVCLEWCMQTYGAARQRNPFADVVVNEPVWSQIPDGYAHGRELASRLSRMKPIVEAAAAEMARAAREMRKTKGRRFDYGCFA